MQVSAGQGWCILHAVSIVRQHERAALTLCRFVCRRHRPPPLAAGRNPGAVAVEDERGRVILLRKDKKVGSGELHGSRGTTLAAQRWAAQRSAARSCLPGCCGLMPANPLYSSPSPHRLPLAAAAPLYRRLQSREHVAKQLLGGLGGSGGGAPHRARASGTAGGGQYGGGRVRTGFGWSDVHCCCCFHCTCATLI